jgi:UDP-N-acetylglucosamine 1-carboxyvinyltransferase
MLVKAAHKKNNDRKTIEIDVQGSKHSFSRVFPSFLQFNSGVLRNVPNIKDVEIQIDIMKQLGFLLDFDYNSNIITYDGIVKGEQKLIKIDDYCSKYSRSLINLYPLFSRFDLDLKEPTGCPIGKRDISWYVEIMQRFGILVDIKENRTHVHRGKLKKVSEVKIRDRSFSSTNIAITCAIEARSNTKVTGPSLEPEILDLICMLKKSGVDIKYFAEHDFVKINAANFDETNNLNYTILPDRNVIVTLVCGALLLGKDIEIKTLGFNKEQMCLSPFLNLLKELNIVYKFFNDVIFVKGSSTKLKNMEIEIKAGHYPLFCSDWQPLIAVLAILGVKMTIEDMLFESRFGYLKEYKKFGVKYRMLNRRHAKLVGSDDYELNRDKLIKTYAHDLRCGAGVGLLSMLHEGKCEIENEMQIMRGYENYDKQLNTLLGEEVYRFI